MAGFRLPRIKLVWGEDASPRTPAEGDALVRTDSAYAPVEPLDAKAAKAERKAARKAKAARARRPVWVRMLSIRLGGVVNLVLWSVIIGLAIRFTGFNPFAEPQSGLERAGGMWRQALEAAGVAVRLGWKPALTGAMIVLPIWLVWRFFTLPFRR